MQNERIKKEQRRAMRYHWPVRKLRLEEEDGFEPAGAAATAARRLAAMPTLAYDARSSAGKRTPDYARGDMPIRLLRGAIEADPKREARSKK